MNFIFSMEQLFGLETTYLLLRVLPLYKYVDGNRTDERIGSRYLVVQQGGDYEKIWVKVEGDNDSSAIEDKLKNSQIPLLAEFKNSQCRLYVGKTGQVELSVKADAVRVVD